jgi:hypothetical protein
MINRTVRSYYNKFLGAFLQCLGVKYFKASLKTYIICQTGLVEVVLGFKKQQVGFDRLNLTRFLGIPFIVIVSLTLTLSFTGCDYIKRKKENDKGPKPVARVQDKFLYPEELLGIASADMNQEDSAARINAYVNSWIRKQLLINEARKKININEAEVERKVLEYQYSLIGYEYQNYYIKKFLVDSVTETEIQEYYKTHQDNFILKKNIVRSTYIKVPKGAPRTDKIKGWIYSEKKKDKEELKSYCLSFSSAYRLADSTWIEFDKLAYNSPLAEIPSKVQFLRMTPYYETSDNDFLYYLKVDEYKIEDNVSPIDFVKGDIKNIILNKRKVELARKLEDEVYDQASRNHEFEIFP